MSKADPQQVQSELCIQFEHASGQCSELTLVKTPLPASFSSSYRELFLYLETHDLLGGFKVNCLSHVHCSVLQQVLQYFIYILSMIFFFPENVIFPLESFQSLFYFNFIFKKIFSYLQNDSNVLGSVQTPLSDRSFFKHESSSYGNDLALCASHFLFLTLCAT